MKNNLRVAKARAVELEKERDEAAHKAKKAERELGKVQRREKRKMKEVDGKAFQASFDRARAESIREAGKMVNEAIEFRVPVAYRTGYKDGVKAACGVLQLEAYMNMTKSIPEAVVPELVLPYTEEECAPLPLEEYPESDEDIEDLSDAEGEDGIAAKKVTGDAGDENMAEDAG